MTSPDLDSLLPRLHELRSALAHAVVGQHTVVEQLLIGLLAGGHCLLEGAPGLGKTLLVRSLGQALELQFRRVQFTPDLMPSDILGTELLEEDHGTGHRHFRFQQGPIFTNLLLTTLQTLSVFTLIWVMTKGGPGDLSRTLPVLAYSEAFSFGDIGYGNAIAIVDTATRETRAIVPVGPRVWGVAITPDGRRAISSDGLSDTVTVVDLASAKAVATVPVGRAPWGVVVR